MNDDFKVGTVSIVGRPNVGKSTLLNALLNQKVAAVSNKPQTTQKLIQAYYEDTRGQIFFTDTPGLFEGKNREKMEKLIHEALSSSDLILYIIDHTRSWGREEDVIFDLITHSPLPSIIIFNKIDILSPSFESEYLYKIKTSNIIKISALNNTNIKSLIDKILENLPVRDRQTIVDNFPVPILSHNSKEHLQELIREKIYHLTSDEVPYQCRVEVTEVESNSKNLTVTAEIKVAKDRYKGILIGKNASMIKKIGMAVRRELEIGTNKHVRINLQVKA